MGGYDPYSSKGCAELVTSAYRNSFFNPAAYDKHGVAVANGRAGNVISGDWAADRLIPDIMRAISRGETVNIRNPHALRPWQHVLEPLSGYLILAERLYTDGPRFADAWNFGPNDSDAQPVQAIVEQLTSQWGDGARWKLDRRRASAGGDVPQAGLLEGARTAGLAAALGPYLRPDRGLVQGSAARSEDLKAVTLAQIDQYTQI